MKKSEMSLKVFMTFVFITFSASVTASELISPSDINLPLKNGAINRDAMTSGQRDSIVIGVFDYEDDFEDIAILHHSLKQIIVYKNLRNGFATPYRVLDMSEKNVKSIKGIYPELNLESMYKRTGLEITFHDGSIELLTDFEIHRHGIPEIERALVPKWDIFNDPRVFIYNISFIQKWQSERSGVPNFRFAIGDVDNDGKDELIWTMHPIANPFPVLKPSRLIIFEYVDENNVRIDWDTILTEGGGSYGFEITDFDNDGNKEFMANSYFHPLGDLAKGFFKCSGEGLYKFYYSGGYGHYSGWPWAIEYRDSVTFNGITAKGMWMVSGTGSGSNHVVHLYRYNPGGAGIGFTSVQSAGDIGYVYHISVGDLDRDGKEEIVLGRSQWGGYTAYLDSTGISTNNGYEVKLMSPDPPGAAGDSFFKDYDGDGYQELTIAGIGQGSGGLSIMKHVGEPGTNSFEIVYSNTSMLAAPNRGVDTNYIDDEYCLLFPIQYYTNWTDYQNTIIYQLTDTFAYNKIYEEVVDSLGFLSSKLYDLGSNGKMNIIAPISYQGNNSGNAFLTIFEMERPLGNNNNSISIPLAFNLFQNFPNPFNNETRISYEIIKPGMYALEVFDLSGRKVSELFNETKLQGRYEEVFNEKMLSSGVYFYRLHGEGFSITKKFILLK